MAKEKVETPRTQCSYVKFHSPVPRGENKEPVYEFKLTSKDSKYVVDEISHDQHTVYFSSDGVKGETPWMNVVLARPIHSGQS
jgi:hypothetical protein